MSEGNIGSIVDSVEDSYRSNARHGQLPSFSFIALRGSQEPLLKFVLLHLRRCDISPCYAPCGHYCIADDAPRIVRSPSCDVCRGAWKSRVRW
jgi:hypothetical protein